MMTNIDIKANPKLYGPDMQEKLMAWMHEHRASYINSGGAKGHIMDMRFIGGYRYVSICLIRYVGRKSGRTMINALGYTQYRGEIAIVASMGGADFHPQWYLNIKAGGPLDFQVATQAFRATWREPQGDELEDAWKYVISSNPLFKTYREISKRQIPIILMAPHEEIPVFSMTKE